ncbi:hypothetical protein A2Z33_07215 [Candidatus Gottesmanbacteria bacterium RBG_16_52_11]|uniref:Nudix hydrolase domain-containing protein n=1 Tax=Candidatus Gottesmanbacteria bacterium RBG_16_52_11 TaxID=1798374 RepID=A0A1F5YY72_9BACT|nr:MAG: hypothetical protein A2Z33_07215 [Candidatus Gottesmanbacteria bacterium RBG_16_52_11]
MKLRINVVCIIERKGKILLGRKTPGVGPYPGKWLIPGGGINLSKESTDEAMKRETLEETGLRVTAFTRMFFNEDVTERHGETVRLVFLYYKITDVRDWSACRPGDDLAEIKWFSFAELTRIPIPEVSRRLYHQLGYIA